MTAFELITLAALGVAVAVIYLLGRVHVEKRLLAAIVETSINAIWRADRAGRIKSWNASAEKLLGYTSAEIVGQNVSVLWPPELAPALHEVMGKIASGQPFENQDTVRIHKDGSRVELQIAGSPLKNRAGRVVGSSVIAHDISRRKATERRLNELAYHDQLVDLPNRFLFADRLKQAIKNTDRRHSTLALHYVDLDDFKDLNDTLGHLAGDGLLKAVARRLRAAVRRSDTVARIGGDEFAIIQADVRDRADAAVLGSKLVKLFAEPFQCEDREVVIGASVGIATYTCTSNACGDAGEVAAAMTKQADLAMHEAKRSGRNMFYCYEQGLGQLAERRMELRQGLHKALKNEEFELHYQPQVDLRSGSIVGAEALVRWNHPELGMIPPDQFISIAEGTGLIVPLGEWVLNEACRRAKTWQVAGKPPLTISVNVSAVQARQAPAFYETVKRALARSGLDPHCLDLELTESILAEDSDEMIASLEGLRDLGIKLSIDDFGTGYASFRYLKTFPVDQLKVDRMFVQDLANDPGDLSLIRSVIAVGRGLGLEVVAEGVETPTQLEFLTGQDVLKGQGYYFSRPVPAGAFEQMLAADAPLGGRPEAPAGATIIPMAKARSV